MAASSSPIPPAWDHCALDADAENPVGCRGCKVDPHERCLAHISETDLAAYLGSLSPGSNLDHRGTTLTPALLQRVLAALRDPSSERPRLGKAEFVEATFAVTADFRGVDFTDEAWFTHAKFTGTSEFTESVFTGDAWFGSATFTGTSWFTNARFNRIARFGGATFSSVVFGGMTFCSDARFIGTTFEVASRIGPLVCRGNLNLTGAVFGAPVTIEAAAANLTCQRARWASTGSMHVRYAAVDFSDAVVEYPLRVTSRQSPFTIFNSYAAVDESELEGRDTGVQITSLRGMDTAHLTLSNVDLSKCQLTGTIHLDQLRLEGRCGFADTPRGLHRQAWRLVRWTPRRSIAEEQHWRHFHGAAGGWAPIRGLGEPIGPESLAPTYRQLRKSLEDSKNEPDAADFYYGEMEMRRHDHERPRAERVLLALYWALSGYGLRASRAIAWLLVSMTVTVLALMLWGLPTALPEPKSTGELTGQHIALITHTPEPVNPDGPVPKRLTTDRFERALRVGINSVVFRTSGQQLTTVSSYTEMCSRLAEPVLLGLAALAIRGRVKR